DGRDLAQILPPAALGQPAINGPFVVLPLGGPNYLMYWPGGTLPFDPGTPFDPPYTPDSVVFSPTAQFRTDNNLTLNGPRDSVRLTFDRSMDPASFTAGDIIKLTGPAGD